MEKLPQPRKHPVQARSRILVSSVLEACLKILDSHGANTLTMEHIAEVSGVTVGSIYQYYSTKEALVAAVYEKILDSEASALTEIGESIQGLSVPEALRVIFSNALRVEIRLHRLNENFHRKYFKQLHLGARYSDIDGTHSLAEDTWVRFIDFYHEDLQPVDKTIAAHILAKGYRGLVGALIDDGPEIISSDTFLESLIAMSLSCLNYIEYKERSH